MELCVVSVYIGAQTPKEGLKLERTEFSDENPRTLNGDDSGIVALGGFVVARRVGEGIQIVRSSMG